MIVALLFSSVEGSLTDFLFFPQHREHPSIIAETQYETETKTILQTVTLPPPANTRLAAPPHPESPSPSTTPSSPRTTAVVVVEEEEDEEDEEDDIELQAKGMSRGSRTARRPPSRWFGGW